MNLTRRNFLGTAAMASPFLFGGCATDVGHVKKKKIRMAAQLFSLRDLASRDLGRTFADIRACGLEGVELWNTAGFPAKEVKRLADLNGLEVCGAHISLDMLDAKNLERTLDYANEVENKNLIVAWMQPAKGEKDVKRWWLEKAGFYSRAADSAGKRGCRVGYHNHYHEFQEKVDGVTLWETFMTAISKDVVVQLDVGSCAAVGEDPVYWYRRFPARSPSVHFREAPEDDLGYYGVVGDPAPGRRAIDWKALLCAMQADPVTEWAVLEPTTSNTIGTLRRSLDMLRAMKAI